MPMPVYSRIYSSSEQDLVSQDEEVLSGLRHITKHFGNTGIRTMNNSLLVIEIIKCSKRIYGKSKFIYYGLADGIYNILKKTREGILSFLPTSKSPPSQQIDMFKELGFKEGGHYAY